MGSQYNVLPRPEMNRDRSRVKVRGAGMKLLVQARARSVTPDVLVFAAVAFFKYIKVSTQIMCAHRITQQHLEDPIPAKYVHSPFRLSLTH